MGFDVIPTVNFPGVNFVTLSIRYQFFVPTACALGAQYLRSRMVGAWSASNGRQTAWWVGQTDGIFSADSFSYKFSVENNQSSGTRDSAKYSHRNEYARAKYY